MKKLSVIRKLKNKKFTVGILGLGYVGLPLLKLISDKKIKSFGFDLDSIKINCLKKNISYISDLQNKELKNINKKFLFNRNGFQNIKFVDFIIICLPTPLKKNLSPDMSKIKDCFQSLKRYLRKDQTIILESTVYPGATEDIFLNFIKKKFNIGNNFYLGYSPERINPGIKGKIKYADTTKVVSGYTDNCKIIIKNFYQLFFKKVHLSNSIQIAEISKLYENTFRAVNIGLVNQIKMITDKMKINIHEVIKASATKPFGFTRFNPGPGMGGHCIPIDPIFLSWAAKKHKTSAKFIDLARKVNFDVSKWIIKKIFSHLKKTNSKKILIVGIAYKQNVNDDRESPSKLIFDNLIKKKIKVDYFDPLIKKTIIRDKNYISLKKLTKNKIKFYDVIIIGTDHNIVNFKMILKNSKFIFDTRGVYSNYNLKKIVHC